MLVFNNRDWTVAPALEMDTSNFDPSNDSALPVVSALVDEAYRTPFAVKEVRPVPPPVVGNVPVVSADDDVAYIAPFALKEVSPVPPFVVASVPARVTAPEVAELGVKPVVPALKVVTPSAVLDATFT